MRFTTARIQIPLIAALITLLLFLSCLQKFENPIDSNYKGDYRIDVNREAFASPIEIFKKYTFTVIDNGTDHYWKDSLVIPKLATDKYRYTFSDNTDNSRTCTLIVYEPLDSESILIIGIRPNTKSDTIHNKHITATNPFKLIGDSKTGFGTSETLTVAYTGKDSTTPVEINSIEWIAGDKDSTLPWDDKQNKLSFVVASSPVYVTLRSKDNFFSLPKFNITFEGYNPIVNKATLEQDTLLFDSTATIRIKASDPDNDPLGFVVIADKDTLRNDQNTNTFQFYANDSIAVPIDTIKDTSYASISIYAIDSTGLRSNTVAITNPHIRFRRPLIRFSETADILEVALKDSFWLNVSGADKYTLIYKGRKDTIKTDSGSCGLIYNDSIPIDTVFVVGKKIIHNIAISSDTIHKIISPREFIYTIGATFPTVIQAKKWITLEAYIKKYDSIYNNDLATFTWKFSESPTSVEKHNSKIRIFYNDSTKIKNNDAQITVTVSAKIGNDSTQQLQSKPITIRNYRPSFHFLKPIDSADFNTPKPLPFYSSDTLGGTVDSIFYQQLLPAFDTTVYAVPIDSGIKITFKQKDTIPVKAWIKDNDGFLSNTDSIKINVTTDKPTFKEPVKKISTYINKPTIMIADVNISKSKIDTFFWDLNNDNTWDSTTAIDTLIYRFPSVGTYTIRAGCQHLNYTSEIPMNFIVTVNPCNPVIKSFVIDKNFAYMKKNVGFKIDASDTNNSITHVLIISNQKDTIKRITITKPDSQITVADSFSIQVPGNHNLTAVAIDETGFSSQPSISRSININQGIPIVDSLTPNSAWIYDNKTFTIHCSDPDQGTISNYAIKWKPSEQFTLYTDSLISHRFTAAGLNIIKLYVIDNNSNSSDTLTDSIFVKPGNPIVDSLSPSAKEAWVLENKKYVVHAHDPNPDIEGTCGIKQWSISWNNDTTWEVRNDSTFTHTFTTSGIKPIKIKVLDEDSMVSEIRNETINVKSDLPKIISIQSDTALSKIFINDQQGFTVTGYDPKGSGNIDYFLVSWQGDSNTFISKKALADSFKFEHTFSDSGKKTVLFRIKNINGFTMDTSITFTVNLGSPVIDTLTPSEIWVNENKTFTIEAYDPNGGTLDSFAIDWNNDGDWTGQKSPVFTHKFDTLQAGIRTIKVKVRDNDLVWTTRNFNVSVKLGRPVITKSNNSDSIIWVPGVNNSMDTALFVYKGGNTSFTVAASDSNPNGSILKYYWDLNNDNLPNDSTNTPKYTVTTGKYKSVVNVWCKDNDSIPSLTYSFYVFPDCPPEAPLLWSPTITGDSLKFVWQCTDDRDGDSVQFQILFGKTDPPVDAITPFRTFNKSNGSFYYVYRPLSSGTYSYQVIARDIRNGVTKSPVSSLFDFTKP